MDIRKATRDDLKAVANIYDEICNACEKGLAATGWQKGVYPTGKTAESALQRGDLFVICDSDNVLGSAIINQVQVDVYANAPWKHNADDKEVMVLHTLAISPSYKGKGFGKAFVTFYEEYALQNGCTELRMDTREENIAARAMYKKLGYLEIGAVSCEFNGIKGVTLVLLEKTLN
ncbi:MAG: GNAT family N-acetyltransferase [Clostridia bacterium]|nr:GNAT family N-acetyltransferase [Clostridia bacterium]